MARHDTERVCGQIVCWHVHRPLSRLNGFDELLPDPYGSVDLCLRIGRAGYLIVYESHSMLQHRMEDTDCAPDAISENERFREC